MVFVVIQWLYIHTSTMSHCHCKNRYFLFLALIVDHPDIQNYETCSQWENKQCICAEQTYFKIPTDQVAL